MGGKSNCAFGAYSVDSAAFAAEQHGKVMNCTKEPVLIRHIVFFSAKPGEDLGEICEGLRLLGAIPYSSHFEVARNTKADLYGNDVDIVVYAEFADRAALDAYKAHPTYAEATRRVRPLRELRFAADIEAKKP
jgi:hypothetical protein